MILNNKLWAANEFSTIRAALNADQQVSDPYMYTVHTDFLNPYRRVIEGCCRIFFTWPFKLNNMALFSLLFRAPEQIHDSSIIDREYLKFTTNF